MRLLVISDIHERVEKVKRLRTMLQERSFNPDLVIVAGDITYFKGVEMARSILNRIRELFGVKVFFVPGNCDSPELLRVEQFNANMVNLHTRLVEVSGYVFYGIGGGGVSPYNTLIEFTEEEFREFMHVLESMELPGLILVTHQPIHGFFDEVSGGDKIGSKVFAGLLHKVKPLLWITGHVHENSGWVVVGKTTVLHPGPLLRGYYGVVELEEGRVKSVNVANLERRA